MAGVLVGEMDSGEKAEASADTMKKCPKCLAIGTDGNKLIGVYMMPAEDSWSLDFPEIFPESNSHVIPIPNLVHPAALNVKPSASPPCGEDCGKCPLREKYGCRD